MTRTKKSSLNSADNSRLKADAAANLHSVRWHRLCERYLPVKTEDSIWRFNRHGKKTEPLQGWKLHISATILEACDVFEKVASFLVAQDVQFKAPKSLDELSKINCGLQYGYPQVGKFITIYPSSEPQAVRLAERLHELTAEFIPITVPFDEQYSPGSSVFYRYGSFASIGLRNKTGETLPAVKNPAGDLVHDDRSRAVPDWISNPFPDHTGTISDENYERAENPLNTYKVFRAISQRGKGGTYQALDFSVAPPRLCIVKEGRRYGEITWDGQDGSRLVKNEFNVLKALREKYAEAPEVLASFELNGNFYLVLEQIKGQSLNDLMKPRKLRFSFRQVVLFALEIAKIIGKIHKAGWVWNDCKPANLIITPTKTLRPIDFESSYPVTQASPFDWRTQGFSKPPNNQFPAVRSEESNDLYALGAVVYFMLTGQFYEGGKSPAIKRLRRDIPPRLLDVTQKLLSEDDSKKHPGISEVEREFEKILSLM